MKSLIKSFKSIDHKMLWALILLGLCPTVYDTVRVFLVGQLPGDYSYSIAGQLSWVNLLYEILSEAIILPLYFFIGKVLTDKKELSNRIRGGLLVSGGIYAVLSAVIIIFAKPLLNFMAASPDIIDASAQYIRIESIASIFLILYQFIMVVLVSVGREKYVYVITISKVVLCLVSDMFLVSTLPVSANLGVNGIGYSNILVNLILFAISVFLISK